MDEDKKREQETDWVDQLLQDVAREVEEEEEWVLLPRETQTFSSQPFSSTRQEVEEDRALPQPLRSLL